MRKLFVIITLGIICTSCGVKDKPKYEAQDQKNNNFYII